VPAGFQELDGVTADVGITAWGESLEKTFIQALLALASLLTNPENLTSEKTVRISLSADDTDSLLVNFLNEIIFLEETQDFLPMEVTSLKITDGNLEAEISGCEYDPARHEIRLSIKAATYHGLMISENEDNVRIQVIFDI
jgi:SHS2 domain-containing protein